MMLKTAFIVITFLNLIALNYSEPPHKKDDGRGSRLSVYDASKKHNIDIANTGLFDINLIGGYRNKNKPKPQRPFQYYDNYDDNDDDYDGYYYNHDEDDYQDEDYKADDYSNYYDDYRKPLRKRPNVGMKGVVHQNENYYGRPGKQHGGYGNHKKPWKTSNGPQYGNYDIYKKPSKGRPGKDFKGPDYSNYDDYKQPLKGRPGKWSKVVDYGSYGNNRNPLKAKPGYGFKGGNDLNNNNKYGDRGKPHKGRPDKKFKGSDDENYDDYRNPFKGRPQKLPKIGDYESYDYDRPPSRRPFKGKPEKERPHNKQEGGPQNDYYDSNEQPESKPQKQNKQLQIVQQFERGPTDTGHSMIRKNEEGTLERPQNKEEIENSKEPQEIVPESAVTQGQVETQTGAENKEQKKEASGDGDVNVDKGKEEKGKLEEPPLADEEADNEET